MKKYDLFCSDDSIIRTLEIQDDRVLVIDCINRKMPVWVKMKSLESYSECSARELYDITGVVSMDIDSDRKLSACTDDELFKATGFTSVAIDVYSSLCCGYSLSWEGGVYNLRGKYINEQAEESRKEDTRSTAF